MSHSHLELSSVSSSVPLSVSVSVVSSDDEEDADAGSELDSEIEVIAPSGGDLQPLVSERARTAAIREELFGAASSSPVVHTSESLDASLERTQNALAEATLFGTHTSAQLVLQREHFIRQRASLAAQEVQLDRSHSLLGRVHHALVTDRFLQIVVILTEIFIIIVLVYTKYYKY